MEFNVPSLELPFFANLLLLLVLARFFGEIMERFKQPAMIGEILAGVLLGPTILNFIQNGNNSDTSDDNTDELIFNYGTQEVYISRACGYKMTFQLDAIDGVVATPDGSNWIQNIEVMQPNIETENEVHVKIYF